MFEITVGDTGNPPAPWATVSQAFEKPRAPLDSAWHFCAAMDTNGKGCCRRNHLAKALTSSRVKAGIGRGDITKNIAKEMYYLASASRVYKGISYFKCAGSWTLLDDTVKYYWQMGSLAGENCKEFFFCFRGSRCVVCWHDWYWNCSIHRSHIKPSARSRSYINVSVIHAPVFCQMCPTFPYNGAILLTGPYRAFLSHTHFGHLTEQQPLAEKEN